MIISDGTIAVDSGSMYNPQPMDQLVVITGGDNPYSWRKIRTLANGTVYPNDKEIDSLTVEEAKLDGDVDRRPAWEANGNRDVLPGTLAVIRYRYLNDNTVEQEWVFDFRDGPIPAKLSTAGAPTTTLVSGIGAGDAAITVAAFAGFPTRNFFRIRIDNEVLEVTAGAGTANWSVTRGVDGSTADAHLAGATITLVGAYAWIEVTAPVTGNDLWSERGAAKTGTFLREPARERNHNTYVPSDSYALLWRKSTDGAGLAQVNSAIDRTSTTLSVFGAVGFPSTPFMIRIDGEYMYVTTTVGPLWTVQRGMFTSPKLQHEANSLIVEAIAEWTFDFCCKDATAPTGCVIQRFNELDVKCENDKLNVYIREVQLATVSGCPELTPGPWNFLRQAGCCDCPGSAGGTGGDPFPGEPCDPIVFIQEEVRCVNDRLNVYARAVILNVVNGCLTKIMGDEYLLRTEGCCECPEDHTGVSGSSGMLMTVLVDCCPSTPVRTVLYADITAPSECACMDGLRVTLYYNAVTRKWVGTALIHDVGVDPSCASAPTALLTISLECVDGVPDTWAMVVSTICAGDDFTSPPLAPNTGPSCSPFDQTYELQAGLVCCNPFGGSTMFIRVRDVV